MSQVLGQVGRLRINMGTNIAPDWKFIQDEVTLSINPTADKVEVASKDVGKHKKYIKTQLDHTFSVTALESTSPATGYLSFSDIYGIYLQNNSDTNSGVYQMEFHTTVVGLDVIAFEAFIDSCTFPANNNEVVSYTFGGQANTLPTQTTVV